MRPLRRVRPAQWRPWDRPADGHRVCWPSAVRFVPAYGQDLPPTHRRATTTAWSASRKASRSVVGDHQTSPASTDGGQRVATAAIGRQSRLFPPLAAGAAAAPCRGDIEELDLRASAWAHLGVAL